MLRILFALSLATLMSACAIGHQYDYRKATPAVAAEGTTVVAVAVSDQRPYVLNGEKPGNFIGLKRGGFGNPFDVTTVSGAPLARDFTNVLVRSLAGRGFDAQPLALAPGQAPQNIPAGTDRVVYVAMREWKTDVFAQVTARWNLEAQILDATGTVLARNSLAGEQGIGATGLEESNAAGAIGLAGTKFTELLGTPEMTAALQ